VTWASVAFALIQFVFGVKSFCTVVIAGSISATLLAAPFVYDEKLSTVGQFSDQSVGQYSIGRLLILFRRQFLCPLSVSYFFCCR